MKATVKASIVAAILVSAACTASANDAASGRERFRAELRTAVGHSSATRYAEAFEAYAAALAIADEFDEDGWRARVLRERGVTYLHTGSFEDARTDFERAVAIFEGLDDVVRASKTRLRIASMDMEGDPERARALLRRVTADLEAAGDEDALQFARLYEARMLTTQGRYEEALPLLADLHAYYAAVGSSSRLTDVLNLKAYALQYSGRLEESRTSYLDLIDAAFESDNQRIVAYAYCNLGDVLQALGEPMAAERDLDRAIDVLDRVRARVPGGVEERLTWLDAQVAAYDRKIALRVDDGDPAGAFAVAERFHAKSLLEEFASPASATSRGELTPAEREVLAPLVELQGKLIREGLSDAETERLRELETRWGAVGRERRRGASQPVPVVHTQSVAAIQRRLAPTTALMAYWVHPRRTWIWIVRRDGLELIQVPAGKAALREAVESYVAPIRDRVRAEDLELRGGAREHLEQGRRLYELLVEPARPALTGVDRLIVVPDDELWYLPFEALVTDPGEPVAAATDTRRTWFADYARASYLLDDFAVLYAPSATVWAALDARDGRGAGLVAIAPSLEGSAIARQRGWSLAALPGARREAERVAALVPDGVALLGESASEAAVKTAMVQRSVLHFATHGYVRSDRPTLSGLFLRPGDAGPGPSAEDGLLQAFEVQQLVLRAELVSLAACDSGLGQLSRAEGIVGVARAFLVAGARNVTVAMWAVDDRASSRLIEAFYAHRQRGGPLGQALRRAKLDLRDATIEDTIIAGDEAVSYAHPYFWSTYLLIGAGSRPE